MTATASNNAAALTGVGASVLGYLFGPLADRRDAVGSVCLFLLVAAIGIPAYFFVFGVKRDGTVAGWLFEPALLKRVALCLAGAISTAFVLILVQKLFD